MASLDDLITKNGAFTDQDWEQFLRLVPSGTVPPDRSRVAARVAYEQVLATKSFDQSSRRLTRWLIALTVVLVALTLVIAGFTILLWRRG